MNKTLELLHSAMNSIDGNKRGMDVVVGDIEEAIWGVEAVIESATNLYMAGRWECAGVPSAEQVALWEALRDALGLQAGAATAAGIGSRIA